MQGPKVINKRRADSLSLSLSLSFGRVMDRGDPPASLSLSLSILLACLRGGWVKGLRPLTLRSRATPESTSGLLVWNISLSTGTGEEGTRNESLSLSLQGVGTAQRPRAEGPTQILIGFAGSEKRARAILDG